MVKELSPTDFGLDFVPKVVCTNFEITMDTVEKLEGLPGESKVYNAVDVGETKVLKKCIADKHLVLKVGTPVMLLYDINSELVNGTRGVVVDMRNEGVLVKFGHIDFLVERKSWSYYSSSDVNKAIAVRSQIPLKPCWLITAHKSQGQTLSAAEVICGNEFLPGQLYVACSRVKTMSGLCLKGFKLENLIPPPSIVHDFYKSVETTNCHTTTTLTCCRHASMDQSETMCVLEESPNYLDDDVVIEGVDNGINAIDTMTESDLESDTDEENVNLNVPDLDLENAFTENTQTSWPFPASFDLKEFQHGEAGIR